MGDHFLVIQESKWIVMSRLEIEEGFENGSKLFDEPYHSVFLDFMRLGIPGDFFNPEDSDTAVVMLGRNWLGRDDHQRRPKD